MRFLIEDLAASNPEGKMVLLVDEYDKPLLAHLGKSDVNEIRDALKEFYSVIKTCEGYQRFAFITGVPTYATNINAAVCTQETASSSTARIS